MEKNSKTILVVDDDMDLREQISMFLEGSGFSVLTAENEEAAKKVITDQDFDLAVLDLMMEHHDSGFVLSHIIKNKDEKIPVIIVTGVTKETGINFGVTTKEERSWIKADSFIQKDLRFEQLIGEINKLLGG